MLKLYTDESPGLKVDPVIVLVLSLGFIFSVVGLHGQLLSASRSVLLIVAPPEVIKLTCALAVIAKITRKFSA